MQQDQFYKTFLKWFYRKQWMHLWCQPIQQQASIVFQMCTMCTMEIGQSHKLCQCLNHPSETSLKKYHVPNILSRIYWHCLMDKMKRNLKQCGSMNIKFYEPFPMGKESRGMCASSNTWMQRRNNSMEKNNSTVKYARSVVGNM